jgi:hypothetical protein
VVIFGLPAWLISLFVVVTLVIVVLALYVFDRPPRITCMRDRPTWLVALWLVLLTMVAGMAVTGYLMWVVSRRF